MADFKVEGNNFGDVSGVSVSGGKLDLGTSSLTITGNDSTQSFTINNEKLASTNLSESIDLAATGVPIISIDDVRQKVAGDYKLPDLKENPVESAKFASRQHKHSNRSEILVRLRDGEEFSFRYERNTKIQCDKYGRPDLSKIDPEKIRSLVTSDKRYEKGEATDKYKELIKSLEFNSSIFVELHESEHFSIDVENKNNNEGKKENHPDKWDGFELEFDEHLSFLTSRDPMFVSEKDIVDASIDGVQLNAPLFAKELYYRAEHDQTVYYENGHSITYNNGKLYDEAGNIITTGDAVAGHYAEDKIVPMKEYYQLLSRFGVKTKDVNAVHATSDGEFVFSTAECEITVSKDKNTITLKDATGLWQEANFAFDEYGNVKSTFTGQEIDGKKEEMVISCKSGAHQNEFLRDARLMLEDKTSTTPDERAHLLYNLLVDNKIHKQEAGVSLDSIKNLELKDLNFIKGYHFRNLQIENCKFENCSFDVSGYVFCKNSSFVGGLIHGYKGTAEAPKSLSFIGLGIESSGLILTGMFESLLVSIKNRHSASQIIARGMDGDLPIFVPDGIKFQYVEKDKKTIGVHDIDSEILAATNLKERIDTVKALARDSVFMTDESKAELTKLIKNNLHGLVISVDCKNKDAFYQILKNVSSPLTISNINIILDSEFNALALLKALGGASEHTPLPGSPMEKYMARKGYSSVSEIKTASGSIYVPDDDWRRRFKLKTSNGLFGPRSKYSSDKSEELSKYLASRGLAHLKVVI